MSTTRCDTTSKSNGTQSRLNTLFQSKYDARKAAHRKDIESGKYLILVRIDDSLIAVHNNRERQYRINGNKFHLLKSLSHISLTNYLTLLKMEEGGKKDVQEIHELRELISIFDSDCEEQAQIVSLNLLLINEVLDKGYMSHQDMLDFTHKLAPLFGSLLARAAEDEVEHLLSALKDIREYYSVPSAHTFAVVVAGHQPRYRALSKLVFTHWFDGLKDKILNVEHHVRYCEGGESVEDAIKLIATVLTDQELGMTFLQNAIGLNQDVLGIAANNAIKKAYLNRMLP